MHSGPQITYNEFFEACKTGNLSEVERGIATLSSQEVIANDNAPLRYAANNGHLAVVNCLLEIGLVRAQAAADDNAALRALQWAALNGHLAVVNRLLQIDAVRELAAADHNLALLWAVEKGHYGVATRLLKEPIVLRYLREHQVDFVNKNNKRFFDKLAELGEVRVKLPRALRMTGLPIAIVDRILNLAIHDVMCGKSTCSDIKPEEGVTGERACPVIFQFTRRCLPKVDSVAPSSSEPALADTNAASSSEPALKRARNA